MADSYKKLFQGQLAAAAATLYTVPAATSTIIKHMRLVNSTNVPVSVTLYRDGTANSNLITPTFPLPGGVSPGMGGWAEWDGTMAFNAGETISGFASIANVVTVTIDGDEVT